MSVNWLITYHLNCEGLKYIQIKFITLKNNIKDMKITANLLKNKYIKIHKKYFKIVEGIIIDYHNHG